MALFNALKNLGLLKDNYSRIDVAKVKQLWETELFSIPSPSLPGLRLAIFDTEKDVSSMRVVRAVLSPTEETRDWVLAQIERLSNSVMNGQKFAIQLLALAEVFSGANDDDELNSNSSNSPLIM